MDEVTFNQFATEAFKEGLGKKTQVGERHFYPLVATHAQTFYAKRFALIGRCCCWHASCYRTWI